MARADAILVAVQRIHEAALDRGAEKRVPLTNPWGAALGSLIELIDGAHAVLIVRSKGRGEHAVATSAGMDASDFARYLTPEAAAWIVPLLPGLTEGEAVLRSQYISNRRFERTEYYNEILRPVRGFYAVGARHDLPTLSAFVAICRPQRSGDFAMRDRETLQAVLPHLCSALEVHYRLQVAESGHSALSHVLDRIDTGLILVDRAAGILFANRTAEDLLGAGNGLHVDEDGLSLSDPVATGALHRLIAGCRNDAIDGYPGGRLEVARGNGRPPLSAVVSPFRSETAGTDMEWPERVEPAAILFVTDLERERHRRRDDLRRRFGLTSAEADVALEIAKGDGRKATAERLGITVGTVRTHMMRIFDKTRVRRQAELVRLLMSGSDGRTLA